MNKNIAVTLLVIVIAALAVYAATTTSSPTSCSGQWTSCSNAFADNTNRATASVTGSANKSGIWRNYGFSIGSGSIVNNVTVRADFFATRTNGFINVRVSGDNGATYAQSHIVGGNTAEQTYLIDVTNDVAWTPTKLGNTNFRVNVTCFKQGGGQNPTCNLDWVPVTVTYTPFDFSMTANPSSDTVVQGGTATTTIVVTLISGNSQTVSLFQYDCPTNATCTLNPTSGTPNFNSTLTVMTSFNGTTPTGTYPITLQGIGGGILRSTVHNLTVI